MWVNKHEESANNIAGGFSYINIKNITNQPSNDCSNDVFSTAFKVLLTFFNCIY